MTDCIQVGFGVANITPERDRQTIYHRGGSCPGDRVPIVDPLYARATAFRTADCLAIWVSLDLCVLSTRLRDRIVSGFVRSGIQADQIALASTHTHSAPTGHAFNGVEPMAEAYVNFMVDRTVHAMCTAVEEVEPAEISFGRATVDLSVNRRQIGRMAEVNDLTTPPGLVDNAVQVARIRHRKSGTTGVLFNYAAHPLTMCREMGVISADFPGRAIARVCEQGGADYAQFLQGCAGNVNVKISSEGAVDEAGHLLAEAALTAAASTKYSARSDLRVASEVVRLPWGCIATLDKIRRDLDDAKMGIGAARPFWWATWAEKVVHTLEAGPPSGHAEVLVQAMKVGDAVFLALPGEVFAEIGLEIKERSGVDHLFVMAYANNGEIGYIPTREAFEEGGMEVDVSPYYYGLFQLAPECGEILTEGALKLVQQLSSRWQSA